MLAFKKRLVFIFSILGVLLFTAGLTPVLAANKNTPTITVSVSGNQFVAGTSISAGAELSGALNAVGDQVSYGIYSDACVTAVIPFPSASTNPVTIANDGSIPNLTNILLPNTTTATKHYWIRAQYLGGADNTGATSDCLEVQVFPNTTTPPPQKKTPTLKTTLYRAVTQATIPNGGAVPFGIAVQDTARITINNVSSTSASGTVTYRVFSSSDCNELTQVDFAGTRNVSGGSVSGSASLTLPVGFYYWQAYYSGDSNNDEAWSTCTSEMLSVTSSTSYQTTIGGSFQNARGLDITTTPAGALVHIVADLRSGYAGPITGEVSFHIFTDNRCEVPYDGPDPGTDAVMSTSNGVGTTSSNVVSFPDPGPVSEIYYWYASYGGDNHNNAVSTPCDPFLVTQAAQTSGSTLTVNSTPIAGVLIPYSQTNSSMSTNGSISTNSSLPMPSDSNFELIAPTWPNYVFAGWQNCDHPSINFETCSVDGALGSRTITAYYTPLSTTTPTGWLVIRKQLSGGVGPALFDYTINIPYPNPRVNVAAGATTGETQPNEIDAADDYVIREFASFGWQLNSASCVIGPNNTPEPVTLNANSISGVRVDAGQTTTCTFVNGVTTSTTPPPTQGLLFIKKITTGSTATTTFKYYSPLLPIIPVIANGGNGSLSDPIALQPGTAYQVSEFALPGWRLDTRSCRYGPTGAINTPTGDAGVSDTITGIRVAANQTTICTFTNSQTGTITTPPTARLNIVKKTLGGGGTFHFNVQVSTTNTTSLGSFDLTTTSSGGTASREINVPVGPLPYMRETDQPGWTLTALSCVDQNNSPICTPSSSGGTITCLNGQTLTAGELVTCTFTNTKITANTATLKVVKKTVGGNGTFHFDVYASTVSTEPLDDFSITTSGSSGGSTSSPHSITITPGPLPYIHETDQNGWALTGNSCFNQQNESTCEPPPPDAPFDQLLCLYSQPVAAGEVITCTLTNTRTTAAGVPPVITDVSSDCNSPDVLTVTGSGFALDSVIYFDNLAVPTTYVSNTELTTDILAELFNETYDIYVTNSPADHNPGTSNPMEYTLGEGDSQATTEPTITSIEPASANEGDGDTEIRITGDNFTVDSVINFEDTALETTLDAQTGELTATIPATDLEQSGLYDITVTEPGDSLSCQQEPDVQKFPVLSTSSEPVEPQINVPFKFPDEPPPIEDPNDTEQ